MLMTRLEQCTEFTASDDCRLREWLHPRNVGLDLPFSVAVARVAPGARTYRHVLEAVEVYLIQCGTGVMHVAGEARPVRAGTAIVVPARAEQWIENDGTDVLEFIAIVSPPWSAAQDRRLE